MCSAVKFRFGNNATLTSTKRTFLPLRASNGRILWMGIEVVPGRTPFLLSKRVLKQLSGTLCTRTDTCWLERLGVQLELATNQSGLYLVDVAKLCMGPDPNPKGAKAMTPDYVHLIQGNFDESGEAKPCWGADSKGDSKVNPMPTVDASDNDPKPDAGSDRSCLVTAPTEHLPHSVVTSEAVPEPLSICHRPASPWKSPRPHAPFRRPDRVCGATSPDSRPVDDSACRFPSNCHGLSRVGAFRRSVTPDFGSADTSGRDDPPAGCARQPGRESRKGWSDDQTGQDNGKLHIEQHGLLCGSSRQCGVWSDSEPRGLGSSSKCAGNEESGRPDSDVGDQTPVLDIPPCVRERQQLCLLDEGKGVGSNARPDGLPSLLSFPDSGRADGIRVSEDMDSDFKATLERLSQESHSVQTCLDDMASQARNILIEESSKALISQSQCLSDGESSETVEAASLAQPVVLQAPSHDVPAGVHPADELACSSTAPIPKLVPNKLSPFGKSFRRRAFKTSNLLLRRSQRVDDDSLKAHQHMHQVFQTAAFPKHFHHVSDTPGIDLLEVFAYPHSRLTEAVNEMGGKAQRVTREDCDLSTVSGQRYLMDLVCRLRPKHILVAPECKAWGSWSRFNMSKSDATRQAILQARADQRSILVLCSQLCRLQVLAGRHFHLEQPAGSAMLDQEPLRPLMKLTCPVLLDMCRFGLRIPGSHRLIRKRTILRTTSRGFLDRLHGTLCKGQHTHQQVAGSARVDGKLMQISRFAASYSRGFSQAVARCILEDSHAFLDEAYPAVNPPRTRKRFKTPDGHLPVSSNVPPFPVRKRNNVGDVPLVTKRGRLAELPTLQVPTSLDPETWQRAFQALQQDAVRVGTCSICHTRVAFQGIQELLPNVDIRRMFVTVGTKKLQSPIGAPPVSEAPWRLSIGWVSEPSERIQQLALDDRRSVSRPDLVRPCSSCSLLVTIFAGPKPREIQSHAPETLESAPARSPQADNAAGRPPDCLEGWGPPPTPLHGPAFRSLTPEEKTDLIRVHRNLGHPSPLKLASHLQNAQAKPHIVAAAKDYVCDACVESTSPRHHRPAKLHDPRDFNEVVGVGTFYWRGAAGFQVHVFHAIDESSCFQSGTRLSERSQVISAFRDSWTHWAGFPGHIYLDPAGELRSRELETVLQSQGTTLYVTAAAWQRGRIERHGHILKEMLNRMDQQQPISSLSEFDEVLAQCFNAKNALVRVKGYSPEQLVLGKAIKIPASLLSDDAVAPHQFACDDGPEAEQFRANLARRTAARQAFHSADNSKAIRRALLRRSTPTRGPYLVGQWVLYYIKRTNPNRLQAGKWHGPARVIAVDGQSVVWLAHGTKTIRAPPEFLRPASLREWNQVPEAAMRAPVATNLTGASGILNLDGSYSPPQSGPSEGISQHVPTEPVVIPTVEAPVAPAEPARSSGILRQRSSDELPQPEQELTPLVTPVGSTPFEIPETHEVDPSDVPLPDDGNEEELWAQAESSLCESVLLSQTALDENSNPTETLLEIFELHSGVPDDPMQVLLAEDGMPWLENPLVPDDNQAYVLEIPSENKGFKEMGRRDQSRTARLRGGSRETGSNGSPHPGSQCS